MLVRKWMSQPVVAAVENDLARRAFAVMRHEKINHMPVVDSRGTIVGIMSVRDLDIPAWAKPAGATPDAHIPVDLSVAQAMSDVVITVGPDDTIEATADLMQRARVHAVPVANERDEVVGLLTVTDVVRALMARR